MSNKSGYYLGMITDIQDDMGKDVMKILNNKGLNKGVKIKTNRGVFEVSNSSDKKTNRAILQIAYPDKNIIFNQYTINPVVLADILEQVENV